MIKNFISTLWGAPDKGIYEEPDPAELCRECIQDKMDLVSHNISNRIACDYHTFDSHFSSNIHQVIYFESRVKTLERFEEKHTQYFVDSC